MITKKPHSNTFVNIGSPKHVWTIGSIHGDINRLIAIHDSILPHIAPGDRIVYLGNYTGFGEHSAAVIDEMLTFRRMVLALPAMMASDFIYIRGAQEEMWDKLLQLPFAKSPSDTLLWMLGNGMSATLKSYGLCPHDGIEACRRGTMFLIKWAQHVRETFRAHKGHEHLYNALVRAGHTDKNAPYPILFVNAGVDFDRTLDDQGDTLWWYNGEFNNLDRSYAPYSKVVRGYDPKHRGVFLNCVTATIDGGCGFGGTLAGAAFTQDGNVEHMFEA